jgi:hypothetical protein
MAPKMKMQANVSLQNRQLLQGRLAAAQWIQMREPEVAREVGELETDPLFRELMYGRSSKGRVIRRSRWPASSLSGGFYEFQEHLAVSSGDADIQDLVERHRNLLSLIRKMGREKFERYFIFGEDGLGLEEICERTGVEEAEGRRILDLVLEVGARSEFFTPSPDLATTGLRYHCIAQIDTDPRDHDALFFRFHAPHWARGRYAVDYESLEAWKDEHALESGDRRRLKKVLKKIELLNMRQDTLFQILSRSTTEQSGFLHSRQEHRRRPLSLRELSRRMGVAPSTVSRAIGRRSVRLPWGEEVALKVLLSGQREVLLSILNEWRRVGELEGHTDDDLMRRLADDKGVSVSRRTVNECRRLLPQLDQVSK